MSKLNIIYTPKIDKDEIKIFEDVFGKDNLNFEKNRTNGIVAGAVDVQIVIDLLNNDYFSAVSNTSFVFNSILLLKKKIFSRNTKTIMDYSSRPRYTILTIRRKTEQIVISNCNKKNKVLISKITSDFEKIKKLDNKGEIEYSDEKLKEYFN
ncbi:MAG: hypothetical protein ACKUBY_01660 [Candidatus Moraniibacteriota bacterium]|jgi:hypothetical protein